MNRKTFFFAVIAAALAGLAVAETPAVLQDDFVSVQSREAVQAELVAFRKAGVNPWSGTYDPLKYFVSVRSREAVTAEHMAATSTDDSGAGWRAIAIRSALGETVGAAR